MSFSHWLLFVAAALATTFSPGPGLVLAVANAIGFGARQAAFSSLGNAAGLFGLAALTWLGVGAALAAAPWVLSGIRLCGALYLIYLGWGQWRLAARPWRPAGALADATQGRWVLFRSGLTVAVTNPSALIFLGAFLPQFVLVDAPLWPQFLILATTFSACALLSHATYVVAARQVAPWLASDVGRRRFRYASGAAFVCMGVGLLAARS